MDNEDAVSRFAAAVQGFLHQRRGPPGPLQRLPSSVRDRPKLLRWLPIYVIAGDKPVSMEETPDGGADLLGWDFARGEMTRDAAEWDEIVGHLQPGLPVRGNTDFAEGDWREVTKAEFDRHVAELRARAAR